MTNLERYKKQMDEAYLHSIKTSLTNLREEVKILEAELSTTEDPEEIEAIEEELDAMQYYIVASQSHQFFIENNLPSDIVTPKLVEKFSKEDLDFIMGVVQSDLYNEFFSLAQELEREYSDFICDLVDDYMTKGRGN